MDKYNDSLEKYQLGALTSEHAHVTLDDVCEIHIEASEVDAVVTIILYTGYMYQDTFESKRDALRWIADLPQFK